MKILLVDNNSLFTVGIKTFLESHDIEVLAIVETIAEALEQFEQFKPDLVLIDITILEVDEVAAIGGMKKEYPEMKIIVFTACENEERIIAVMQAGAYSYLLKDMKPERFVQELRSLSQGTVSLPTNLIQYLLQKIILKKGVTGAFENSHSKELTERQIQVLKLLTKGFTYKEIAVRLNVKEATIKYHINEMLNKHHMTNRLQLIVYASQKGFI